MSAPSESNGRPSNPEEAQGVLSNLPRTRPQRSTPRRTAARKAMASSTASQDDSAASNGRTRTPRARVRSGAPEQPSAAQPPKPKAARKTGKATAKPRTRNAPRRPTAAAPVAEPVPMQGFESESDRAHGPVHPPGGAELVASAAEIIGELAKAGLSTGERLLKDALSRLPLS